MKLNKIEKLKLQLPPYLYYEKLDSIQEKNIRESDRFYLKNFGIYNTKLRPNEWMLRLRIAAGRIGKAHLQAIINAAKQTEAKIILTARAQIELHRLSFSQVIRLHKEFERVGLTSFQTLTDNFRNIVTDPLDGVGKSSYFAVYPLIVQMQELFLKRNEYIGLIPRKFNTAISANAASHISFFGNDCYFALAKKDTIIGFKLFLGGKNTEFAQDLDIFVQKEYVVKLYKAIIDLYKAEGPRESRTKARLFHMLQDLGKETMRQKIAQYAKMDLERGGELLVNKEYPKTHFPLKDGTFAYRYQTDFGEVSVEEFETIVKLADEYEIRLGCDQNIYILGVDENFRLKDTQRGDILVCAGERYCIFSLFDTKEAARHLPHTILQHNIKIGYSGCLKGCGRHILADIGFVGIRTNSFGKVERGVRLYLGGLYTKGTMPARLIYWAVPLRKLNPLLDAIIAEFERSGYKEFEDFSLHVLSTKSQEVLAWYFLRSLETSMPPLDMFTKEIKQSEIIALQNRLFS